ncbi:hypothetical protein AB4P97_05815 [Pseudomonas sp. A1230]|uniref:hypothetical protein n=1 Tax=Pseudomonas sp. A1230 TaxID=3235106 RepID=UPI003784E86E
MTFKDTGKFIALILSIALTTQQLYDSGYNKGKSEAQTLIDGYKLRQEEAEKATKVVEQQVSSLKLELQRAVELSTPREQSVPDIAFIEKSLDINTKQGISIALEQGETKSPFDDGFYVSLQNITYTGSPSNHVATLVLGRKGSESRRVENATVGDVTVYEGYEVRVMKTSTFSVGVQVEKI